MDIPPALLLAGSFRVRRARRDDVEAIAALLQADAPGQPPRPNAPDTQALSDAGLEPYLAAFEAIDADPAHFLAVVEDGAGSLAATAQLTLIPCLAAGAVPRLQVEAVHVRRAALPRPGRCPDGLGAGPRAAERCRTGPAHLQQPAERRAPVLPTLRLRGHPYGIQAPPHHKSRGKPRGCRYRAGGPQCPQYADRWARTAGR